MMLERIANALDSCADSLRWSNAKIAGEIGVSEQSVRNYRQRKSEPSVSVYERMRDRIPGFRELVEQQKAVAELPCLR